MLHTMTYDHLKRADGGQMTEEKRTRWLIGLHAGEKQNIVCVKQSFTFSTSHLKHLSDTRKHEMCY